MILVLLLLLEVPHHFSATAKQLSAIKTTRLNSPRSLKWNAGGIYDDRLGWVSVATENTCFNVGEYDGEDKKEIREKQCDNAKMGPWVSFLGRELNPTLSAFESNGSRWEYDKASIAPALVAGGDPYYVLEDAR